MGKSLDLKSQKEVKQVLRKINQAWTKGTIDDLAKWFHDDIVIAAPDGRVMGRGSKACIKSYKDFCENAQVSDFIEADSDIHLYRNTAVASYTYEISYVMSGKTHNEKGWEVFFFTQDEDMWVGVWRMVIPLK